MIRRAYGGRGMQRVALPCGKKEYLRYEYRLFCPPFSEKLAEQSISQETGYFNERAELLMWETLL